MAAAWLAAWIAALASPLALDEGSRLLGDELGHGWRAMWTANRTVTALRGGQGWPLDADGLGAPLSGGLVSPSPLFDALSAALRLALGPVATFNGLALAHLGLAAWGAWTLARLAGARWEGRLVAATVFAFNAMILSGGAASGAPEVLGMAWAPVAIAAVLWVVRAPGPLSALGAALALVAMSLADPHLAFFAPLLLPLVLLPELALALRGERRAERLRRLGWLAAGLGLGAALATRLLAPLLEALAASETLAPPGSLRFADLPDPDALVGMVGAHATLSGLLLPGGELLREPGAALSLSALYAGWVALVLAGVAAGIGRLRWVALGAAAVVLAMGPYLLVTPDGWRPVPAPWWLWMREIWPATQAIASPVRAMAFGYAALAVLAALGADRLVDALPRARVALPWLLSASILAEMALLSPVPAPLPTASVWLPGAVGRLGALPGAGAVIDWPQREPGGGGEISRYVGYQMWHGKRIFADTRTGPGWAGVEANPFFAALERITYGEAYRSAEWTRVSELPVPAGVAALRAMGFDWLVFHPWHVAPDRQQAVATWLSQTLTLEAEEPDGSRVYALRTLSGAQR